MKFTKPIPKSELEKIFLDQIELDTPAKVKNSLPLDLNQEGSFDLTLTKDQLGKFDPNGDGLGIEDWFALYEKEAKVSTAGIRGLQNPLYPWDTRYPLNLIGMTLATMGKILVAKEIEGDKTKLAACEVRYNSKQYVELIARLQAGNGIKTCVTEEYLPIPIFMTSFLIFMNDFYGGEYVTSSHAISKKIATKDLNTQGSQYIPDESLRFVEKVREILGIIQKEGSYTFHFAAKDDPNVDRQFLKTIENGAELYAEYLKSGVATNTNLELISAAQKPILIECMGGSITHIFEPILHKLGIRSHFNFLHTEEDPFFHGIGKSVDQVGKFNDLSCDTTIMKVNSVTKNIEVPVVESVHYTNLLKDYAVGSVLLMTDPDADRLVTSYIDSANNITKIKEMGLVYSSLGDDKILVILTPNQSFLLTIDFQYRALQNAGLWDKYNWFLLKTTASQRSWDEWAVAHNVPVFNTPVGFKELADFMMKIERKLKNNESIVLTDVYGKKIDLGANPRLLFAGEESGGEIFGPSTVIKSKGGREAISMREKSAGEAIIITAALSAHLEKEGITLVEYLDSIYHDNKIKSRYEIRIDQRYYNENEPDINKLLAEKEKGMQTKTFNNSFFLTLTLGYRDGLISFDQLKAILSECFPELNFADLQDAKFVGDGNYFLFVDKCLEIRPSGTDAINKGYSYGIDQWECIKYATAFAAYSGERTKLHTELIPTDFYNKIEDYAYEQYLKYKNNQ